LKSHGDLKILHKELYICGKNDMFSRSLTHS